MNNISSNVIGGVGNKSTPLISFNSIVDTDIGLVRLIYNEYLNPNVFDIKFFQRDFIDIIKDLYFRKDLNPLTLFAKEDQSREKLDQYYKEFIDLKEKEILNLSMTTEIINLIDTFNDSMEIVTSILYYTPEQKRILEDEPILANNNLVSIQSLDQDSIESYTQIYFKNIEESKNLYKILKNKTIYFAFNGTNLNEDNTDVKDTDLIDQLISFNNKINLYDMYRSDIISRKEVE